MKLYNKLRKEKGASALISIFMALAFIVVIALVIDGGLHFYKAAKLQNAVDASVIATSHHIGSSAESLKGYANKYLAENGFDVEEYGENMEVNIEKKAIDDDLSDNAYMTNGFIKLNVVIRDNGLFSMLSGFNGLKIDKTGYAKCDVQFGDPENMRYSIFADNSNEAIKFSDSAIQFLDRESNLDEKYSNIINNNLDLSKPGSITLNADVYSKSDINFALSNLNMKNSSVLARGRIFFSNSLINQNSSIVPIVYNSSRDNNSHIRFTSSGASSNNYNDDVLKILKLVADNPPKDLNQSRLRSAFKTKFETYLKDNYGITSTTDPYYLYLKNVASKLTLESGSQIRWIVQLTGGEEVDISNYAAYQTMAGETSGVENSGTTGSGSAGNNETIIPYILNNDKKTIINIVLKYTAESKRYAYKSGTVLPSGLVNTFNRTFVQEPTDIVTPNLKPKFEDIINGLIKSATNSSSGNASVSISNFADKQNNNINNLIVNHNVKNSETFFINAVDKKYTNIKYSSGSRSYVLANANSKIRGYNVKDKEINKESNPDYLLYGVDAVKEFNENSINSTFGDESHNSSIDKVNNNYIDSIREKIEASKGYQWFKKFIESINFVNPTDNNDEKEVFLYDKLIGEDSERYKDLEDKLNDKSDYNSDIRFFEPSKNTVSKPTIASGTNTYYDPGKVKLEVYNGSTRNITYDIMDIMNHKDGLNGKKIGESLIDLYWSNFQNASSRWQGKWDIDKKLMSGQANNTTDVCANSYFDGSWGAGGFSRPNGKKHILSNKFSAGGLVLYPTYDNNLYNHDFAGIKGYAYTLRNKFESDDSKSINISQGCGIAVLNDFTDSGQPKDKDGNALAVKIHQELSVYRVESNNGKGAFDDNNRQSNAVINGNAEVGRIAARRESKKSSNGVIIIDGNLTLNGWTDSTDELSKTTKYFYAMPDCKMTIIVTGDVTFKLDSSSDKIIIPEDCKLVANSVKAVSKSNSDTHYSAHFLMYENGGLYVRNLGEEKYPAQIEYVEQYDEKKAHFSCIGDGECYISNDLTLFKNNALYSFNNLYLTNSTSSGYYNLTNNTNLFIKGDLKVNNLTNNSKANIQSGSYNGHNTVEIRGNFYNYNISNLASKSINVIGSYTQQTAANDFSKGLSCYKLTVGQNAIVENGSLVIENKDTNNKNVVFSVGYSLSFNNAISWVSSSTPRAYNENYVAEVGRNLKLDKTSKFYVNDSLKVAISDNSCGIYMEKGSIIHVTNHLHVPFLNDSSDSSFPTKKPAIYNNLYSNVFFKYTEGVTDIPNINYRNINSPVVYVYKTYKFLIDITNNSRIQTDMKEVYNYGEIYIDDFMPPSYDKDKRIIDLDYILNNSGATLKSKMTIKLNKYKTIKVNNVSYNISLYNNGNVYADGNIQTTNSIFNVSSSKLYLNGGVKVEGSNNISYGFYVDGNSKIYINRDINLSDNTHLIYIKDGSSGVFSVYGNKADNAFTNVNKFENYGLDMNVYLGTGTKSDFWQKTHTITLNELIHRGRMFVYGNFTVNGLSTLYGNDDGNNSRTWTYASDCGKLIVRGDYNQNGKLVINKRNTTYYKQRFIVKAYENLTITGVDTDNEPVAIYGKGEIYGMKKLIIGKNEDNIRLNISDDGLAYFGDKSKVPSTLSVNTEKASFRGQLYLPKDNSVDTDFALYNGNSLTSTVTMSDNNDANRPSILAFEGSVNFLNSKIIISGLSLEEGAEKSYVFVGNDSKFTSEKVISNTFGELYLIGNVSLVNTNGLVFNSNCINYFGPINASGSIGNLERNTFIASGKNYFCDNNITIINNDSTVKTGERNTALAIKNGETYVSRNIIVQKESSGVRVSKNATLHCTNLSTYSALYNNGNLIIRNNLVFTDEDGHFKGICSDSITSNQGYQIRNGYDGVNSNNTNAILYVGSINNQNIVINAAVQNNGLMYIDTDLTSYGSYVTTDNELTLPVIGETSRTIKNVAGDNISFVTSENSKTHFSGDVSVDYALITGNNCEFTTQGGLSYSNAILNGGNLYINGLIDDLSTPHTSKGIRTQGNLKYYIINGFTNSDTVNKNAKFYAGSGSISSEGNAGSVLNYGEMYLNGSLNINDSKDYTVNNIGLATMSDSKLYISGSCNVNGSGFVTGQGSTFMCDGSLIIGRCARINANDNLSTDVTDSSKIAYVYVGGAMSVSEDGTGEAGELTESVIKDNIFRIYPKTNMYIAGALTSNSENFFGDDVILSIKNSLNTPNGLSAGKNFNLGASSGLVGAKFAVDHSSNVIFGGNLFVSDNIDFGGISNSNDQNYTESVIDDAKSNLFVNGKLVSKNGHIKSLNSSLICVSDGVYSKEFIKLSDYSGLFVNSNAFDTLEGVYSSDVSEGIVDMGIGELSSGSVKCNGLSLNKNAFVIGSGNINSSGINQLLSNTAVYFNDTVSLESNRLDSGSFNNSICDFDVVGPSVIYGNGDVTISGSSNFVDCNIVSSNGNVEMNITHYSKPSDSVANMNVKPNAISSYTKNVTINSLNNTMFLSLIYSPLGTVEFSGANHNVWCSTMAKNIIFDSYSMDYNPFYVFESMDISIPKPGDVYLISKAEFDSIQEDNIYDEFLD